MTAEPDDGPRREGSLSWIATWVTVGLAALVFVDARASRTGFLPGTTPFDVMLGQALTPFQYRLLVPKLALFVVTLFPSLVPETRLCLSVIEALFFVGFFACVDRLARRVVSSDRWARSRIVLGLLAVPFAYLVLPSFRPFYNASDTPSLFFLSACALALVEERPAWFMGLFLVGTLNRETTLVVLVAWGLAALRRGTLRRDAAWIGGSVAGFVAIRVALRVGYASNSGAGAFQLRHDIGDHPLHLVTNAHELLHFPRSAWFAALVLAPLLVALGARRRVAHPVLVACVDVTLGVVPLLLVVGNMDELRMFADVLSLVLVAVATAAPRSAHVGESQRGGSA